MKRYCNYILVSIFLLLPTNSYSYTAAHGPQFAASSAKAITQLLADAQGYSLTNRKEALVLRTLSIIASSVERLCSGNYHGGMGVASKITGCGVDLCDLAERCEEFLTLRKIGQKIESDDSSNLYELLKPYYAGVDEQEIVEQEGGDPRWFAALDWRRLVRLVLILGEWFCAVYLIDPIHRKRSVVSFVVASIIHLFIGNLLRLVPFNKGLYKTKSIIGALRAGTIVAHNLVSIGTLVFVPIHKSHALLGPRKRNTKRAWFENELWWDQDVRPGLSRFDDADSDEEFECPICYGEANDGTPLSYKRKDMVIGSECLNVLCKKCWKRCKENDDACPCCRRKVVAKEIEVEDENSQEVVIG